MQTAQMAGDRLGIPQIAIVGAGPVGLSAAILLRQRGIPATLYDRATGPCQLPQAHVVNVRTSEILREMGCFAEAAARAADPARMRAIHWVDALAGRKIGALSIDSEASGSRKSRSMSPVHMLNLAQDRLESVLLNRLRSLGGDVAYGHRLVDAKIVDGKAELAIQSDDGEIARTHYRYALGCDGARSRVRDLLGIEMKGPASIARYASAYFRADLSGYLDGEIGPVTFVAGPQVRGSFIGFDLETTWAFMCVMPPEAGPGDFGPEVMRELIRRAAGDPDLDIELLGVGSWNMSAQVAADFRKGPFFLLGDAAHRFPPTGGLGLNTGVQDAHNLAWKLGLVLSGCGNGDLLESYEAERQPIAIQNCEHSAANAQNMAQVDEAMGTTVLAPVDPRVVAEPVSALPDLGIDGESQDAVSKRARIAEAIERQRPHFGSVRMEIGFGYARDRSAGSSPDCHDVHDYAPSVALGHILPHIWIDQPTRSRSIRDLCDPVALTILADGRGIVGLRDAFSSSPGLAFQDVSIDVLRALDMSPDDAILVRPDGHVAWFGRLPLTRADAVELAGIVRQFIASPVASPLVETP